jgi:A/G-specific adenine glycosylase
MLQQTQAQTMIPYYERWLDRWPTLEALARANLDEVLKLWEGLGYYGRARRLLAAAHAIVAEGGGRLPSTAGVLAQLPGIGPYTAGAIASIAFGEAVPALDGNAKRVFARLLAMDETLTSPKAVARLEDAARSLVPEDEPGAFNQAVMDLGATICRPRTPDCPACPLGGLCEARRLGLEREVPRVVPRGPIPSIEVAVGVICRNDAIFIQKRPEDGLLGGLWEFPGGKLEPGETPGACLARELEEELGICIEVAGLLIAVDHAYTHFRVRIHAFLCRLPDGSPGPSEGDRMRWVPHERLDDYAFPAANRRILEALPGLRTEPVDG